MYKVLYIYTICLTFRISAKKSVGYQCETYLHMTTELIAERFLEGATNVVILYLVSVLTFSEVLLFCILSKYSVFLVMCYNCRFVFLRV